MSDTSLPREDDVLRSTLNTLSKPHGPSPESTDETYSEAETEARREAALKRMLATPPKAHQPIGKRKRESSQPK